MTVSATDHSQAAGRDLHISNEDALNLSVVIMPTAFTTASVFLRACTPISFIFRFAGLVLAAFVIAFIFRFVIHGTEKKWAQKSKKQEDSFDSTGDPNQANSDDKQ